MSIICTVEIKNEYNKLLFAHTVSKSSRRNKKFMINTLYKLFDNYYKTIKYSYTILLLMCLYVLDTLGRCSDLKRNFRQTYQLCSQAYYAYIGTYYI